MMRKSEIEKWVVFIGFYVLWIVKGKDTNKKKLIVRWDTCMGSGISCQWMGWSGSGEWVPLDEWVRMLEGRERGPPFILKGEVFLLVWTPTEAFMLVGVWTMSSDWSGYEGWTMFPDWSELNHALWLVRTWWLKICELNRELWLVRTWWVNPASWLVTTSWLKAESWLVDTNYVLINY